MITQRLQCQAEGRNLDTDITIIHKFKAGTPNERFLWNALKQTKRRNKILQRNFIIMGCEKDIIVSDYVTNAQTDTITHSKI